jgi:LPS-assembly protein
MSSAAGGFDAGVQYSADIAGRCARSSPRALVARRVPHAVSATYRYARGLSEQMELGWQWPVWKSARGTDASARHAAPFRRRTAAAACTPWAGSTTAMKDSRITDSVLGVEYDAGCWIARVVAVRLSTGRSEATTGLRFELELVGLSRLGSNPLKVLKDNIPGYRLLREDAQPLPRPTPQPSYE